MIIVNFSHPLTAEQRAQVESLAGKTIRRVIDVPTHFDDGQPFAEQVTGLVDRAGLTAEEWQTLPMVVILPSFGAIVAVLLAHLHGLCGHFPTVARLRASPESLATRFEVAELIRLDQARMSARAYRNGQHGQPS